MITYGDTNMLEHEHITLEMIRFISKKLTQELKKDNSKFDSADKALIFAANNFLSYNKIDKRVNPIMSDDDAANCFDGFYSVVNADYMISMKRSANAEFTKKEIAERVACALLFIIWNIPLSNDQVKYKKIPLLSYTLDLPTGRRCITKIGFRVVHPDDPDDEVYLDLLKLGKEIVENDVIEMTIGAGLDTGYCAYRIFRAMDTACRIDPNTLEEPERIMDIINEDNL